MARNPDIELQSLRASRATTAPCRTLRAGALAALAAPAVLAACWFGPHASGADEALDPAALVAASLEPSLAAALAIAFGLLALRCWQRRRSLRGQRLGAYRLDEKIGEGGMGVVYKASHTLLQRPAAIKLLPADRAGARDRKRFEREVQLTSRLTHPNTISIYDYGRTATGTFYYAMEYVDGCDLQTLVDRHGPQDPARVAHVLAQVAGALREAHRVGLIHRDIKPANVMLCERGGIADVVKLLDFGLIKELAAGHVDGDAHHIAGTPLYISPEALTEPENLDARSDLYAVGALGYFLLTGEPPFSGKSVLEVCSHHVRTQPIAPSQRLGAPIPSELEALIMACLAKSPEHRPASAGELQEALLAFAAAWTEERAARWWAQQEQHDTLEARFTRLDQFLEHNMLAA